MNEVCILDRWEGDTAVIEVTDEADQIRWQQVPRQQLPDAREGDVLLFDGQHWKVDETATALRGPRGAGRRAPGKGGPGDGENEYGKTGPAQGVFFRVRRSCFVAKKLPCAGCTGERKAIQMNQTGMVWMVPRTQSTETMVSSFSRRVALATPTITALPRARPAMAAWLFMPASSTITALASRM